MYVIYRVFFYTMESLFGGTIDVAAERRNVERLQVCSRFSTDQWLLMLHLFAELGCIWIGSCWCSKWLQGIVRKDSFLTPMMRQSHLLFVLFWPYRWLRLQLDAFCKLFVGYAWWLHGIYNYDAGNFGALEVTFLHAFVPTYCKWSTFLVYQVIQFEVTKTLPWFLLSSSVGDLSCTCWAEEVSATTFLDELFIANSPIDNIQLLVPVSASSSALLSGFSASTKHVADGITDLWFKYETRSWSTVPGRVNSEIWKTCAKSR